MQFFCRGERPFARNRTARKEGPHIRRTGSGVVVSNGIDGDRRQELVSPLFEMLPDDNSRRLCNSFVGANGCSPEREPREKRDLTYGEPGLGLSVLAE